MRTRIFDGFKMQSRMLESLRRETAGLERRPCVAVVRLGESLASTRYIQRKREALQQAGMQLVELPLQSPHHLAALLDDLNASQDVHGLILQLPLGDYLEPQHYLDRVTLCKDIDGLSSTSISNMSTGQGVFFRQCAVQGVIQIIEELVGPEW